MPAPSLAGERAAIDSILALLLAVSFAAAMLTGFRLTSSVVTAHYRAFDRHDGGELRCKPPLASFLAEGSQDHVIPSANGLVAKPCWPPRSDHAAPGRKRNQLPDAMCALAHRAGRDDFELKDLRCALP